MNKIIIRQPAGIGDIFFTQKIAYYLHNYYKLDIIWPVIPEFYWIKDYIKVPFIEFVSIESEFEGKNALSNDVPYIFEYDNFLVVPLQRADWVFPGSVMDAKYKMVDLEFEDWADYFSFERNIQKENELYCKILGLSDDSKYCLVSKNYGSPPKFETIDIRYHGDLDVINLSFINNITLIDWCKVIENASEIHTMDSSINFIIDKLNLKTNNLSLYLKPGGQTAKHLFKTKFNKIYEN